jgi:large subunit ribosomal protein L1
MPTKEQFLKAIETLRKNESENKDKVKFNQSVDLLINLKSFDISKNPINILITIPHRVKEKKLAAFLERKSPLLDTITKAEFEAFKDKKKLKQLVGEYDFFVASAKLMPLVATTFGRALGPAGKMPSPTLGVVMVEDDANIKAAMTKIDTGVKVRAKEPSLKLSIGKQDAKDLDIAENALAIFTEVYKLLPRSKDNLRSIMLKLTMGKPVKVEL